jgi:hypothetical protein
VLLKANQMARKRMTVQRMPLRNVESEESNLSNWIFPDQTSSLLSLAGINVVMTA